MMASNPYGPPLVDFSFLARLADPLIAGMERARERELFADVGQHVTGESPDYKTAAQKLFAAGRGDMGLQLLQIGQQYRTRTLQEQASRDFSSGLSGLFGGGSDPAMPSPSNPAAPAQPVPRAPAFTGGGAAMSLPSADVESQFLSTVRGAGLTNPVGLAAVGAYGSRESGFSPGNVNRTWSDPSESGQAGVSGGIMSYRGPRLQALQAFARERGEAGNGSPTTQALFFAQEDPSLLPRLQAAKSPEEANSIMANAWRFAGYDRPGGENERRLNGTRTYLARLNGTPPSADLPAPGATEAQGFYIPSTGAPAPSGQPEHSNVIAGRPVAAVEQLGLGKRIPFLIKAASHPHLPAGQKEIAKTLLSHALSEAKIPDGAKEFMWARANGLTQATTMAEYAREKSGGDAKITGEVAQRRQAAGSVGLAPDSPGYQTYLLTGKMPREDQQPLTASDKKAVQEADEGVMVAENVINALREAKQLSANSLQGPFASERGYLGSLLGTERGINTAKLDNIIKTNALSQLKSIFGAAPTEGERKILLEIQGSSSQPDVVRQDIYDRAIKLAERRLAMNRERASELRGGTYYKPDGGRPSGREGVIIPPAAADHLRQNPHLRSAFEEKYGRGSAAQVLGR